LDARVDLFQLANGRGPLLAGLEGIVLELGRLGRGDGPEDLCCEAGPHVRVAVLPSVEPDLDDVRTVLAVRIALGPTGEQLDALAHQSHERALSRAPIAEQPDADRRLELLRREHRAQLVDLFLDAEPIDGAVGVIGAVACIPRPLVVRCEAAPQGSLGGDAVRTDGLVDRRSFGARGLF
jgi:hypothetical protein